MYPYYNFKHFTYGFYMNKQIVNKSLMLDVNIPCLLADQHSRMS